MAAVSIARRIKVDRRLGSMRHVCRAGFGTQDVPDIKDAREKDSDSSVIAQSLLVVIASGIFSSLHRLGQGMIESRCISLPCGRSKKKAVTSLVPVTT